MKFGPRWEDRRERTAAGVAWRRTRSLRLDDLLAEEVILALHQSVRELPHPLIGASAPHFAYQYGAFASPPEDACEHVWCQFARWWWTEGLAFVRELTQMELAPPEDRRLVATLFQRGSFLDPHNDHDGARRCAYVLGLTRVAWHPADGGHLEFLAVDGDAVSVTERWSPGWNTLDLFDVTGTAQLHQVPILLRAVERRAISGWWY